MMEENVNIFGKNQGEIGSLDKNLVLRTRGKIYIRYGKKYIDLLDDKGNLNVKIPKVITKVNSKDDFTTPNSFYLLDGSVYVNVNGEIIQITGIDGNYLEYGNKQILTKEQINIVQNNIGLTFDTIEDAQEIISKGIVHVGDQLYYISDGSYKELSFKLEEPLSDIQDLGNPEDDDVAIIFNRRWSYTPIVTKTEFNDFKDSLSFISEEAQNSFDSIQYSTVYSLKSFQFITDTNGNYTSASFETSPANNLQDGDVVIMSTYAVEAKEEEDELVIEYQEITTTDIDGNLIKSTVQKESVLVLEMVYKSGVLQFIQNGEIVTIEAGRKQLKDDETEEYAKEKVNYLKYKNKIYIYQEDVFKYKKLYVKVQQSNPFKFKIDYDSAQIALEENYPDKIIPHTVLGDLDNKSEYYNNIESFRTYKDKENSQGLYSDQAVFNGVEFRESLNPEDDAVYNYPRYSETLGNKLQSHLSEEEFNNVIPTIGLIKQFQPSESSSVPVGSIVMWLTNTPPDGWLFCDGKSFDQDTYPQLYSILNNSNITPDLSGRFPVGAGSKYNIGETGGEDSVTLTESEMPNHTHSIGFQSSYDDNGNEGTRIVTNDNREDGKYMTDNVFNIGGTGGGMPHENRPPFYALQFIIKAR